MPLWNSGKERQYQEMLIRVTDLESENASLRAYEKRRNQERDRRWSWLRHQLNQAIQNEDTKYLPPQTAAERQSHLFKAQYRREVYRLILSMMDAQVPPRFNPANGNDYADDEEAF